MSFLATGLGGFSTQQVVESFIATDSPRLPLLQARAIRRDGVCKPSITAGLTAILLLRMVHRIHE